MTEDLSDAENSRLYLRRAVMKGLSRLQEADRPQTSIRVGEALPPRSRNLAYRHFSQYFREAIA